MERDTERLRSAMKSARTRSLSTWLLIAAHCVPLAAYSKRLVEFPGPEGELRSPDGRYVVQNVDSDKEPHHTFC